MNKIMQGTWNFVEPTQNMRELLFGLLSDADLTKNLGGDTLTLGALFREMGEVQYSYTQSFKTFKQDFTYRAEPNVADSLTSLRAWFTQLDADLKATIEALTDADIDTRMIDRGFQLPVALNVDVYLQAILIFYGKASVYLRAWGKPLPQQIKDWIG
jgi:hypothetical protein